MDVENLKDKIRTNNMLSDDNRLDDAVQRIYQLEDLIIQLATELEELKAMG